MQTVGKQASVEDVVNFISCSRSYILRAGGAGLLLAVIYVVLTPNSFEARWQMSMAQMVAGGTNSNSEEPAALIQRLKSTLTYPSNVLEICGKSGDEEWDEYLDKTLQVQTVKDVPNTAEFKLRAAGIVQASSCANAIVAMVVEQQRLIIGGRQAGKQEQLLQYQKALGEAVSQLETLKKTELGNFGYLAMLDKLTWLRSRIDGLQEELFLSQKHPAKLIAPVDVSRKPVAPKVPLVLLLGLLLGLTAGVLYAIAREGWRKAKSEV